MYIGSPQSKDGNERKEEKIDAILEMLDSVKGRQIIATLDQRFPKK